MQTRICCLHGKGDIRIESETVPDPGPDGVLLAIGAGGICGSDLHYFQQGGVGTIRVREPIILGHEAAGTIMEVGRDVVDLSKGDRVAINPSQPCGKCRYCLEGLQQHCLDMRFMGSAMRLPHEQGLFRDHIAVPAAQCVPVGPGVSLAEAACAEPLAVCLHARQMAGPLEGRRVLI
ncbi:MAG: alcohol dehydrogenase catalytic domain-containing protein, partial [Paracoccaceae bacterium]|nr:alcohol dehydrogenase catalytic domain-containing protein [Paracoccaceae bacterium]